jgi:hypothetical protein
MRGKGLLAQVEWSVLFPTAILKQGLLRTVPFGSVLLLTAVGISTKIPR